MDTKKKIKLDESTVSMVLGALVVVVVGLLVYNYFSANRKAEQGSEPQKAETTGPTSPATTEQGTVAGFTGSLPTTHVVAKGEDLWKISLVYYGSGYNWVDIAKENEIGNPNLITTGVKLSIPKVEAKVITTTTPPSPTTVTGSSYNVVRGDTLWSIAVRAFGDGYRWVDIAKTNKLANPGIIHPGNTLSIPR